MALVNDTAAAGRRGTPRLTVFVLCRNRPVMACEAIESLLASANDSVRLIVSDNSTDERLRDELARRFPAVEVRRRDDVDVFRHMRMAIAEADTEFVVLFHDDDLVMPEFCARMIELADRHPDAVAWACNAEILDVARSVRSTAFETDGGCAEVVLASPAALFSRYVLGYPRGFAMFPSYMYRTSAVRTLPPAASDGGKYSDVAWLIRLAGRGKIVWGGATLMTYRLHGGNDGLQESLRDRLRMVGFLKRCRDLPPWLVDAWRMQVHRRCLRTGYPGRAPGGTHPRRERIQRAFVLRYRVQRLLRAGTWLRWFGRARRVLGLR